MGSGNSIGGGLGGAPSIGGGGRGGRSVGAMPRLTWFEWAEVRIGRIQAVTGEDGKAEVISDKDHLRSVLGYDEAKRRGDTRPVLIYFHWPHEHKVHGKLTTTVCSRTLDDEQAARWSKLFRCVQVDMGESLEKYTKMIGDVGKPHFVALNDELEVVAELDATKSSSKLRKALEKAHGKFPAAVKALKKAERDHEKAIRQAKKLEKQKKYEEAVKVIDKVRFGDIRVTKSWEKAYKYGMTLAQKAERELESLGR